MKKFTVLFAAAALLGGTANAETFGNPKDKDGNYIVKWNPETESFATANDWEIDETFIFAIDVTGTSFETALQSSSRNPAVIGRGMAYDLYVTSAPEGTVGKANIDGRLFHIKGNVYGMVINFFQQHTTRYADDFLLPNADYTEYGCLELGAVTEWNANIFPFGWAADNPGAEWWDAIATPSGGEFPFASAPYTGTKTSPEFFYGDVTPADYCPLKGLDAGAYHSMCDNWGGYAAPEFFKDAIGGDDITMVADIAFDENVNVSFYNIQGQKLNAEPQNGIYIRREVKADGSAKSLKIVK